MDCHGVRVSDSSSAVFSWLVASALVVGFESGCGRGGSALRGDSGLIALSPRSDENLEQLALTLDPENFVVRQQSHDRVFSEVLAI